MIRNFTKYIGLACVLSVLSLTSYAQDFTKAGEYLDYINNAYVKIAKEQWDYTRAMGHGKRAKLVEKRRTEVAQAIQESKRTISKMPAFNKSTSLRDSIVAYLKISYIMVNEDYAKIVNMEEIAEQSYDAMEAYMLAKDAAREKETRASEMVSDEVDKFAADNHIHLIESDSKLSKKMRIAGKAFEYYNKVYLIFFKAYKQDGYLTDAINKADINAVEQNRNSLLNYAQEGIEKIKGIGKYEGDETLPVACRQLFDYYNTRASVYVPSIIEYYSAKDKFEKIKASFDKIKQSARTQENVDTFNNAVKEVNLAMNKYNDTIKKMNEAGTKSLNNWNSKSDTFLDNHIP